MDFSERRSAALAILARTGMSKWNYAPPGVRILWRLGINIPPPHFAPFGKTALFVGTYFTIFMCLGMWIWGKLLGRLVRGWQPEVCFGCLAASAVAAGILFGLVMAAYYARGRRKYNLPKWEDLEQHA